MILRFALATALGLLAWAPASATTVGVGGLDVVVLGTETEAELRRAVGAPVSDPDSNAGAVESRSEVFVPLNPGTGEQFDATSVQQPNGDSSLEYYGQWYTYAESNTEYDARTKLDFQVTNDAFGQYVDYRYTIENAFIELVGGGDEQGLNPFLQGPTVRGVGARLRHRVEVDGTSVVDRAFTLWSYYLGNGDLEYRKLEERLSGPVLPITQFSPSTGVETIGYEATLPTTAGTAQLGWFEPFDTKTVSVVMQLQVIQASEAIVWAGIDDPGSLSGEFVAGTPPSTVPAPATAWLLLSGLGGLVALRRSANGS